MLRTLFLSKPECMSIMSMHGRYFRPNHESSGFRNLTVCKWICRKTFDYFPISTGIKNYGFFFSKAVICQRHSNLKNIPTSNKICVYLSLLKKINIPLKIYFGSFLKMTKNIIRDHKTLKLFRIIPQSRI